MYRCYDEKEVGGRLLFVVRTMSPRVRVSCRKIGAGSPPTW